MKILQMSKYADPVGGAELYMLFLTEELRARGHEVFLFGTSTVNDVDEPTRRIVPRADFVRDELFEGPELVAELERVLERFRPDVIHVHNMWGFPLGVDRLLARWDAALVQTCHDFSTVCPNSWSRRGDGSHCPSGAGAQCFLHDCGRNYPFDAKLVLYTRMRNAYLAHGVDVALAPSKALTEMTRAHGFRDVRHLYYFVDETKLTESGNERRPDDRLTFLGRISREKGIDTLIDAMPAIRRARPAATLTIVGDGPMRGELEARAARLGLGDAVRFTGKVPYEEVQRFYREATALVVPSHWTENSPLSIYECLHAGLPVVGSNVGGIPDLVIEGETGVLAEPRDVAGLAAAAVRLLSTPADERARLSANGRARAAELTREANLAGVLAAYEDALAVEPRAKPDATLALDEDLLAIVVALTTELHQAKDHIEWLNSLPPGSGKAFEKARGLARKLGLPRFRKGST